MGTIKEMDTMTKEIINQVKAVKYCLVLLELLEEIESGIPEGHAYMAFMQVMDLNTFQSMMTGLKKVKAIESNNFFITRGNEFKETINSYRLLVDTFSKKMSEAHA
jgi:hypothetical protein